MITRIELKNFMSHEHTVIEPACGLTVISGPNNCGKSAIVSALQILCYNDESTFVTRHGEKECSIKVFADGHEIEWIRTKNKSTKYVIDGQQHDRLGRGGTPDCLHEILKIKKVSCDNQEFDVHFGAQQNPVFLLNDSPRAAAQFFASSSDAVNLIGMQTRHKQKVRDRKQEKRRLTEQLTTVNEKLEQLEPVAALNQRVTDLESEFARIESCDEDIAALHNLLMAIQEKRRQLELLHLQLESLDSLHSPPLLTPTDELARATAQIVETDTRLRQSKEICDSLTPLPPPPEVHQTHELQELVTRLASGLRELQSASHRCEAMSDLIPPPELGDCRELQESINQLRTANSNLDRYQQRLEASQTLTPPPELPAPDGLQECLKGLKRQELAAVRLNQEIEQVEGELKTTRQLIEAWAQANPGCPTCGAAVDADQWLSGHGGCQDE